MEVLTEMVVSISHECTGGQDTWCEEGELVRGQDMHELCGILCSTRCNSRNSPGGAHTRHRVARGRE